MLKSVSYLTNKCADFESMLLDQAPHTAQDVQTACHCSLSQVLKTLVFIGRGVPIITVVPGDKRISSSKLEHMTGDSGLRMAKPSEVLAITSCKVGEVSPFGIESDAIKILDEKSLTNEVVITGSGQGNLLIRLSSFALRDAWDGIIGDITD